MLNSKGMSFLICLVVISAVLSGLAFAADLPFHPEDREEVPRLYSLLGQNIGMEADHYAEYSNYRENLRLRDFWRELERLNLNRDEIIKTIALLEQRMEGQEAGIAYPLSNEVYRPPEPGRFSLVFSNWRFYYSILSGGFLVILSSLLIFSYCPICRREVVSFLHEEDRHPGTGTQRKAA
ncbi:MAG: hypothetical protein ACE5FZ_01270 [Nitrospiria bacterium]